jgi:hypothetical protein
MRSIPLLHVLRVLAFEEDAAERGYAFHGDLFVEKQDK